MAIYAAANIGLAVENFRERGYAELGGLILNRRNVKREEEKVLELSEDLQTQIIGSIDRSDLVQEAEELGETVMSAFPDSDIASSYRTLADRIASDCGVEYPAREEPIEGVNSEWLMQKVQVKRALVLPAVLAKYLRERVKSIVGRGEQCVVLTMGAGDIGELVEEIKQTLTY
jgi:nitrogenase subunit NifH